MDASMIGHEDSHDGSWWPHLMSWDACPRQDAQTLTSLLQEGWEEGSLRVRFNWNVMEWQWFSVSMFFIDDNQLQNLPEVVLEIFRGPSWVKSEGVTIWTGAEQTQWGYKLPIQCVSESAENNIICVISVPLFVLGWSFVATGLRFAASCSSRGSWSHDLFRKETSWRCWNLCESIQLLNISRNQPVSLPLDGRQWELLVYLMLRPTRARVSWQGIISWGVNMYQEKSTRATTYW